MRSNGELISVSQSHYYCKGGGRGGGPGGAGQGGGPGGTGQGGGPTTRTAPGAYGNKSLNNRLTRGLGAQDVARLEGAKNRLSPKDMTQAANTLRDINETQQRLPGIRVAANQRRAQEKLNRLTNEARTFFPDFQ